MLTQRDIDQIENIVEEKVEEGVKHLPSRDEFFEKMDEVMGELKTVREQQEIITGKTSNHEGRLEKLEELHPESGQFASL